MLSVGGSGLTHRTGWISNLLETLITVLATTSVLVATASSAGHDSTAQRSVKASSSKNAVISFQSIVDEFWQWRLQQVPEFASAVGVHDHDDRLESFTLEAFRHRKQKCETFLAQLDGVDRQRLNPDDVINLLVLRRDLQTFINGYRWLRHSSLNPINDLEGVYKDFSYWIDSMEFETEESYINYTQRLRALVTQVNEQMNLMREAIRYGLTNHRLSVQMAASNILTAVGYSAVSSPFFKPFNESINYLELSHSRVEIIRTEGLNVIQDHVLPAYRRLAQFMQHDYLKKTRPKEGLVSLPGGNEFYEACLRWYLSSSSDVTASALHQLGRQTVDSILTKIEAVRKRVGFNGRLEEFMKYANGANKLFYKTEEEMLQGYKEIVHNRIPAKLSTLFYDSFKMSSLHVQAMPFDGPAAILLPGSVHTDSESAIDDTNSAVFFVNVHEPLRRPKWQMYVTTLHETIPGKHLQACYAQNQSLAAFRRMREYRKMFSVPFQFPFNTAYTEGWALYAEFLGYDLDLFQQPFHQFGQLHSELYKACEMVVDTGIHAIGWSAEDAVDYIIRTTGIPRSRAESDTHRIVTFPGQATAAEYGHLKLKTLRRLAQQIQGDRFDIREFHHQILRLGPVSLDVLEMSFHQWLSDYITRSSSPLTSSLDAILLILVGVVPFVAV